MKIEEILSHVSINGCFEPPQYKGGYDNIPFSHEEYHEYTDSLMDEIEGVVINDMETHYSFVSNGKNFILRFLSFGEYVKQLCTEQWYVDTFVKVMKK